MAAEKYLNSEETRQYLALRHDLHRSPVTLSKMANDGRLPADKYDGRRRLHAVSSLDAFAARTMRPTTSQTEGIPVMPTNKRDLTSPRFGKSSAGATDTEKRSPAALAKGGRNRDVSEQNADTARPGKTGHDTGSRGAGRQFTEGGGAVPGKRSAQGISAPSRSGRTGNVAGEAANRARGPRRDKTRDYAK
jgi:hypothetical protein